MEFEMVLELNIFDMAGRLASILNLPQGSAVDALMKIVGNIIKRDFEEFLQSTGISTIDDDTSVPAEQLIVLADQLLARAHDPRPTVQPDALALIANAILEELAEAFHEAGCRETEPAPKRARA